MSDSDLNKTVSQIIRQIRKPDISDEDLENVIVSPVRKSLRIKMSKADDTENKAIVKRKAVKKSSYGKRKAEAVIIKRDIKMRRLGSDNLSKDDSIEKFDLLIAPNSRFVGKVGKACSIDVITNINSKLSSDQMSIFKSSRFGVFLGLGKDVLSLRLIHSILLREVHYPDMSELWFNFGSRNMRFSVYEFGLVSGLVCGGDESRFSNYCAGGTFFGKFFGNENRITRQVIEAKFNEAVWENDDEAVKFAKLYFVQCFLLGSLETTLVDSRFIHLLDCPDFDDFPWGKYSFQLFVQSTKNKLWTFLKASKQSTFYRLYGFPHAIQFWFYETLITVPEFLCSLSNAAAFPRFMRWSPKNIKKIQNFDFKVYDDPTEKVKAGPNIKATDFELSQNIVSGLNHQHFIADSKSDDDSILEIAKSACFDFVNELKDLVFDSTVEYSYLELDIRKQIYDSIVTFENNKLTDIFKDNSVEAENVEEEQMYSSDNDGGDSSSKDNDNPSKEETDNEEQKFNDEDATVLDGVEIDVEVHDQSIAEHVSDIESGKNDGDANAQDSAGDVAGEDEMDKANDNVDVNAAVHDQPIEQVADFNSSKIDAESGAPVITGEIVVDEGSELGVVCGAVEKDSGGMVDVNVLYENEFLEIGEAAGKDDGEMGELVGNVNVPKKEKFGFGFDLICSGNEFTQCISDIQNVSKDAEEDGDSNLTKLMQDEVDKLGDICSEEFIVNPSDNPADNVAVAVPSEKLSVENVNSQSDEIADLASSEAEILKIVTTMSAFIPVEKQLTEPADLGEKLDESKIIAKNYEKVAGPKSRQKLVFKRKQTVNEIPAKYVLLESVRNLDVPEKVAAVGTAFVNHNPLLIESVHDMCNQLWLSEFTDWIDNNKYKKPHPSGEIYYPREKILRPGFTLGGEGVTVKDFFHKLNTPGGYLESSHIDCLFAYLRKKCKFLNNSYTVCGNWFDQYVQNGYKMYLENQKLIEIPQFEPIYNFIVGEDGLYKRAWGDVKHVLFPIHLKVDGEHQDHFILGRLSFDDRCFYVYNSWRTELYDGLARDAMTAYSTLLPLILELVGFYDRADINFYSDHYIGKNKSDPFSFSFVEGLPCQENSDCGVFAAAFAEYLIEGERIPKALRIKQIRNRYAVNLYMYGRWKNKTGYISE